MKAVKETVRKYYKYEWEESSTFTPAGTITATSGWSNVNNAFDGSANTYARCGTSTDYIDVILPSVYKITGFIDSGYYISGQARDCNMSIHKVENGIDTLIANGTGGDKTTTYTSSATFSEVETDHIRFYLINSSSDTPPTTSYPTAVREITITGSARKIVEATEEDYDFYEDVDVYKLPKINNTYYGINQ